MACMSGFTSSTQYAFLVHYCYEQSHIKAEIFAALGCTKATSNDNGYGPIPRTLRSKNPKLQSKKRRTQILPIPMWLNG
jgi:hypothetical protein